MIVFAWVNDEEPKRAFESSDDAYRVFRKMLESGHPPDDWNQLLAEARAEGVRLLSVVGREVFESSNAYVEKYGLPLAQYRMF